MSAGRSMKAIRSIERKSWSGLMVLQLQNHGIGYLDRTDLLWPDFQTTCNNLHEEYLRAGSGNSFLALSDRIWVSALRTLLPSLPTI
jgi:hypothetical protein